MVDLPLPVGPTMPTVWPGRSVKVTSRSTGASGRNRMRRARRRFHRETAADLSRTGRSGITLSASQTARTRSKAAPTPGRSVLVICARSRTGWKNLAR